MKMQVSTKVSWVGKIDWELKKFHGEEFSTHHGSTYNSYLIEDEKTALVDTVWLPYANEFVANLRSAIPLDRIDYIIMNHGEQDHSGALPELMRHIPDVPIYCTANAVKSLRGQYHQDWNFQIVKTGDRLSLGKTELTFVEVPMLHWPDSMICYLSGEEILFSNDAFGQHYAAQSLFNDAVDPAVLASEGLKYYANILTPFSRFVTQKIEALGALNLPIRTICPSHGVIWRDDPMQIVNKYLRWAADYKENQITILYDTMWEGTRLMAEAIAQGIQEADPTVAVKVLNTARRDKNDIITEVFRSKGILVGSSTINKGILSSVAAIMEEIKGLAFKQKKAAAFGTYGWSGEGPKILGRLLAEAGFAVMEGELRSLWSPDEQAIAVCREFGRRFAEYSR